MLRLNALVKLIVTASAVLTTFSTGQEAHTAPPAPVPAQIARAKKIFIANTLGVSLPLSLGGADRTYNQFYAAMKTWGRYEIVSTPADSDVILEISFIAPLGSVGGGASVSYPQLDLVVSDPKTRVSLWWLEQNVEGAFRAKTFDKNFDQAMDSLVKSLQALVMRSAAPDSTKQ